MNQVIVHKGRTTVVSVSVGMDVSADTITSKIREGRNAQSTFIASWNVQFESDGTDGELILTLDNSITSGITQRKGYMDMKRITDGEPVSVFDDPLEVVFAEPITE